MYVFPEGIYFTIIQNPTLIIVVCCAYVYSIDWKKTLTNPFNPMNNNVTPLLTLKVYQIITVESK